MTSKPLVTVALALAILGISRESASAVIDDRQFNAFCLIASSSPPEDESEDRQAWRWGQQLYYAGKLGLAPEDLQDVVRLANALSSLPKLEKAGLLLACDRQYYDAAMTISYNEELLLAAGIDLVR